MDRQKYDVLHQSSMSDVPYATLESAYVVATVSFEDDAVKVWYKNLWNTERLLYYLCSKIAMNKS